ncbi:MAG: histidine phosphatase family protein [Erysipelotrichaceae bacterium]|nr:histidine phosphatase family protein [Erysipelotrichaceae bacterium]
MTKTVYFHYVRHGKTLFNELGRMQGHCDSPLLEEGIEQAYAAKEALKDIDLARAYTSTSERCIDTAHIILEGRDVPLIYTKKLKEMSWGTYEGALISAYQEEIDKRRFGTRDWTDVGGENQPMLKERILNVFSEIYAQAKDGDHILIVSHGAVFMNMISQIFGYDLDGMLNLMKEHGESMHPVVNGYAADFKIQDGKYILSDIKGHYEGILEDMKRQAA